MGGLRTSSYPSICQTSTPISTLNSMLRSRRAEFAVGVDYPLSTGTCIASDNLNLEGETFDVPIEDHKVVKLWNTPGSRQKLE